MRVDLEGWLREPIRDNVVDLWRLDEIRYSGPTPFQHVLVARTALGVTLFCDNNPQSAETGQLEFHEAELIPAILLADQVRRVLVIGCSEGTVPRLAVLAGANHVDHVDIDPDCVRICAEQLPYGYTWHDVRRAERGTGPVRLHYEDGARFVRQRLRAGAGASYDVIVLDLPEEDDDSHAGHNTLYAADFLTACRALLAPGGVLSTHVSRPCLSVPSTWSRDSLRRPWRRFGEVFGTRIYYRSDEQPWGAVMLGRADSVPEALTVMRKRLTELPYTPRTLDEQSLLRATYLPPALRDAD